MPWHGLAYRHVASSDPRSVVDTTAAAERGRGRWNSEGEHTLYLTRDPAIAIAEFARHLAHDRRLVSGRALSERRIFELRVSLECVLDLREPRVSTALSVSIDPAWIRDVLATRALAKTIRRDSPAQAIIVPSMAFLDQPERWNMVVFREKLPTYPEPFLSDIHQVGVTRDEPA
jgi:RES domain-containing protein